MDIRHAEMIVATTCSPEIEEKFNSWYNQVHIPILFKADALKEVVRYKMATGVDNAPRYLAVYKFDDIESLNAFRAGPEIAAARKEAEGTWKAGGREVLWQGNYEVIKTWRKINVGK